MYYVIDDEELECNLGINLHMIGLNQVIEVVTDELRCTSKNGKQKFFPTGDFKIVNIRYKVAEIAPNRFTPGTEVYIYLEQITEPF